MAVFDPRIMSGRKHSFCVPVIAAIFLSALILGSSPAMADDTTPIAYTANLQDNTASIINMNDNTVVATIYGLNLPAGIAISSDYKRIYVTESGSNDVAFVNSTTYQVIDNVPVGSMPYGIAVSPDGKTLYVANNEENTVSVLDANNDKLLYNLSVGGAPYGVRANPVSGDVYVANSNDGTISVIRGRGVIATIPVGKAPTNGLALTPDGKYLFVANTDSNNVSVINTTTNRVEYSVSAGNSPSGVAISPDGWYAYIANAGSQNISIMQISDRSIRVSLNSADVSQIAASSDGKTLYVVTKPDGKIRALNSATGAILGNVDVDAFDIGSMAVPSEALVDIGRPNTTIKLYGEADSAGEFLQQVTVNLTANDYPSGNQIYGIKYSWDGQTWMPYSGNITLRNARSILLYYYATDSSGNKELVKSHWINIVDSMPVTPTPKPIGIPDVSIPPKPTALPPEQIPTVTPMSTAQATGSPAATDGFQAILAILGLVGAIYLMGLKKTGP